MKRYTYSKLLGRCAETDDGEWVKYEDVKRFLDGLPVGTYNEPYWDADDDGWVRKTIKRYSVSDDFGEYIKKHFGEGEK